MDRAEAERIYEAGKDVVIGTLLATTAHNEKLERRNPALENRIAQLEKTIERLTRNSSNSSRPPSSDGPGVKN